MFSVVRDAVPCCKTEPFTDFLGFPLQYEDMKDVKLWHYRDEKGRHSKGDFKDFIQETRTTNQVSNAQALAGRSYAR